MWVATIKLSLGIDNGSTAVAPKHIHHWSFINLRSKKLLGRGKQQYFKEKGSASHAPWQSERTMIGVQWGSKNEVADCYRTAGIPQFLWHLSTLASGSL